MHYIEQDNYPVAALLNMGNVQHGLAHFTDKNQFEQFKKEYKHIRRYRRKLLFELQVWSGDRETYYAVLCAKWLEMTEVFKHKWGVERVPLLLRYEIHEIREMLDMKVIRWPPVYVINKQERLEVPEHTDLFGGVLKRDELIVDKDNKITEVIFMSSLFY